MSLLGVVGYFVDQNDKILSIFLGLRRLQGSYSGEYISEAAIPVFEDYHLKEKLNYFILNNADNNNKCVEYILKKMRPELEFYKYRFRCFGYILNLIAQAFLFGTDSDYLAAVTARAKGP
jgi:hypothetical protein